MGQPKFSVPNKKYQSAKIVSFDSKRFKTINFLVEWLVKLEFIVSEGLFADAFFIAYQLLRISRQLNDFIHILQIFQIFTNLLVKADCTQVSRVLNFVADLAQNTNQLGHLIEAYLRIGRELTEQRDYDKAIRVLKKVLKVCWIQNDHI